MNRQTTICLTLCILFFTRSSLAVQMKLPGSYFGYTIGEDTPGVEYFGEDFNIKASHASHIGQLVERDYDRGSVSILVDNHDDALPNQSFDVTLDTLEGRQGNDIATYGILNFELEEQFAYTLTTSFSIPIECEDLSVMISLDGQEHNLTSFTQIAPETYALELGGELLAGEHSLSWDVQHYDNHNVSAVLSFLAIASVPEPAYWTLLVIGLLCLRNLRRS